MKNVDELYKNYYNDKSDFDTDDGSTKDKKSLTTNSLN